MNYHKIKCEECGSSQFKLSVTPHGFYLFAVCDYCGNLFMFGLDWKNATYDNEYVRNKAILFRRFK